MTMTDETKDPLDHNEVCARCGVIGQDRRTLWMACFYAMNELAVPFEKLSVHGVVLKATGTSDRWGSPDFEPPPYGSEHGEKSNHHPMFTLRVCKGCRAEWMQAIKEWYRAPPGDVSRWNNDGTDYLPNDSLPAIVAELERLRVESAAVEQRIGAYMNAAKTEELRREAEDATRA